MRSIQAGFKSGIAGESQADLLVRLGPTIQVDIGLKSLSLVGEAPDLAEVRVSMGVSPNLIGRRSESRRAPKQAGSPTPTEKPQSMIRIVGSPRFRPVGVTSAALDVRFWRRS